VRTIRQDVDRVGKEIAEKHGLSYEPQSASYDDDSVKFKMLFGVPGEKGATQAERDYHDYCEMFGLEKDWLGKKFRYGNDEYVIAGLKPRASKYPVVGKRADGKKFKFPVDAVKFRIVGFAGFPEKGEKSESATA
jgi:hypothetical protein